MTMDRRSPHDEMFYVVLTVSTSALRPRPSVPPPMEGFEDDGVQCDASPAAVWGGSIPDALQDFDDHEVPEAPDRARQGTIMGLGDARRLPAPRRQP